MKRIITIKVSTNEAVASSRFAGFAGEHFATLIKYELSNELNNNDYTYRVDILTAAGAYSAVIKDLQLELPQVCMIAGSLSVQLTVYSCSDMIHKTHVVTLDVKPSISATEELDTKYEGLLEETLHGEDGRGIIDINKTSTNGLVDTYTITYTDGTTSTYTVTNGKDGTNGTGENFAVGTKNPNIVYTFSDAYVAWCNGEKFPIAFCGDSTFAGYGTSGDTYTFCNKLQEKLRTECGNNATIYQLAKSGSTIDYGISNFDIWFKGEYADTKMIGIGWGINDRLNYTTYQAYKNGVYQKLDTLIQKVYSYGMQPFLVTSQATLECGVQSNFASQYPLRDSNSMNVCANEAKKELSEKYGIPLIDLNEYSSLYLTNSLVPSKTIISDRLHFGNVGNEFEAGFLFSKIVSRVIEIKNNNKCVITYANQNLRNAVPEDKVAYGGDYKVYVDYTKSDTSDIKIMDTYVYIKDFVSTIKAVKHNETSSTYVKIDDVVYELTKIKNKLDNLDIGLHHLEVFTGTSSKVDFIGFIINDFTTTTEDSNEDDSSNGSGDVNVDEGILLYDTTNYSAPNTSGSGGEILPCTLTFGYNKEDRTSGLSNTTITKLMLPFANGGTFTIGKVNMNEYGTGVITPLNQNSYEVTKGNCEIVIDNLALGETETLAIGTASDTAKFKFGVLNNDMSKNGCLTTSDAFKNGTALEIVTACKIYGRRN